MPQQIKTKIWLKKIKSNHLHWNYSGTFSHQFESMPQRRLLIKDLTPRVIPRPEELRDFKFQRPTWNFMSVREAHILRLNTLNGASLIIWDFAKSLYHLQNYSVDSQKESRLLASNTCLLHYLLVFDAHAFTFESVLNWSVRDKFTLT